MQERFVSGTLFTKHYVCTVVKFQFLEETLIKISFEWCWWKELYFRSIAHGGFNQLRFFGIQFFLWGSKPQAWFPNSKLTVVLNWVVFQALQVCEVLYSVAFKYSVLECHRGFFLQRKPQRRTGTLTLVLWLEIKTSP